MHTGTAATCWYDLLNQPDGPRKVCSACACSSYRIVFQERRSVIGRFGEDGQVRRMAMMIRSSTGDAGLFALPHRSGDGMVVKAIHFEQAPVWWAGSLPASVLCLLSGPERWVVAHIAGSICSLNRACTPSLCRVVDCGGRVQGQSEMLARPMGGRHGVTWARRC